MKEWTKLLFPVLGLVAIFGASTIGYKYLSSKTATPPVLPKTEQSDNAEESIEPDEETSFSAPSFTVYDKDGNKIKLSDKAGKPIIINFWATWCGPCKSEMPHFEKAFLEYGEEIEFLMVNPTDGINDTQSSVNAFLEKTGYTFPVYYDFKSDACIAYGISSFPITFFINKDGELLGYYPGAMTEEVLYECIDILMNN